MKRFFKYLLALPLFVLATSCTENEIQEEESVVITGLNDKIEFAAVPTGDYTFSIETNVEWSIAVKNLDWLTVSPSRGIGEKEPDAIVISPSLNEAFEPREGTMTLTAGTVTRNVTISQAAAAAEPVFTVDGLAEDGKFYIEALATEGASFTVSSNNDWTAKLADMDWATVSPLSGTKNTSATITVIPKSENEDDEREGTISFSYGADAPKVVNIIQRKFTAEISLSVNELTASRTGNFADPVVKVTSNAPWTAVSDAEWLTVDTPAGELGETDVKVTAATNETGAERKGNITFTNKNVTAVLTVTQGNEYVEASVENISTSEETVTFEVKSNIDWKVSSSETWATVSPAEGTGDATITVTLAALASGETARTAKITIASKTDESLFDVVNLEQKAPVDMNFVNIYDTPVLFCSDNYQWNITNNADYASEGQTGGGKVPGEGTGKGTGMLLSYSHYTNKDVYMQFYVSSTPMAHTPSYIMASEGNITVKGPWTDDAFEFHIPVANISAGHTLKFEYGVYGTSAAPAYWNSEVSMDGGNTWASFDTGETYSSPNTGAAANTFTGTKQKDEAHYVGLYQVPATLTNSNIIVRLRCADATYGLNGRTYSEPGNGTIRIIGGEGHIVSGTPSAEGMGPKISATAGTEVPEPSTLSVSPASLTTVNTPVSFDITSNTSWQVSSQETWLSVSPVSGDGNATVIVTPEALEAGAASRTATIIVTAADGSGLTQTVILTQNAPEDVKPTGNYVDLVSTPVLFNTNQQAWNTEKNPDFASEGQTGAVSGTGTGKLQSYSHYENPEVYMAYNTNPRSEGQNHPLFIMSKEGNIAVKSHWLNDAFEFHIPLWKAKAGQTLYFDYGVRGTNAALAYWNSEVSFDGGQTWQVLTTGEEYTNPDSGVLVNTYLGNKKDTEKHFSATCAIPAAIDKKEIIVRLRCADIYKVSKNEKAETVSSSATLRLIGYGQINADHANIETVMGPQIYIK